jgi:hypothetical protein
VPKPKSKTSNEPDVFAVKRAARGRARATTGSAKVKYIEEATVNLVREDFKNQNLDGQHTFTAQSGQSYTVATRFEAQPENLEDGEEAVCWSVQYTRGQILKLPDRAQYFEADDIEKLKISTR